jgi:hypothetical protein
MKIRFEHDDKNQYLPDRLVFLDLSRLLRESHLPPISASESGSAELPELRVKCRNRPAHGTTQEFIDPKLELIPHRGKLTSLLVFRGLRNTLRHIGIRATETSEPGKGRGRELAIRVAAQD